MREWLSVSTFANHDGTWSVTLRRYRRALNRRRVTFNKFLGFEAVAGKWETREAAREVAIQQRGVRPAGPAQ